MNKNPVRYVDAHNKAVRQYQKSALFLLYAGIVGVFASIIGVVQMAATTNEVLFGEFNWPSSGFALSLSLQIYLSTLFLSNLSQVLASFLIIIVSVAFGALFGFLGYMATKGRRIYLITGLALYTIDFAFMFFVYHVGPLASAFVWTNYAFTLAMHVVVIGALIFALIKHYQVIDIEKKFKKEPSKQFKKEEETETLAHGE